MLKIFDLGTHFAVPFDNVATRRTHASLNPLQIEPPLPSINRRTAGGIDSEELAMTEFCGVYGIMCQHPRACVCVCGSLDNDATGPRHRNGSFYRISFMCGSFANIEVI